MNTTRVLMGVGLTVGLGATVPASGHMNYSLKGQAYTIEHLGAVYGHVVVVYSDEGDVPVGYSAGFEHWAWGVGTPWRNTFTLVPSQTVPPYGAHSWEKVPHEHFDLSTTVPFPSVVPSATDKFYRIQSEQGTGWLDRGYMWRDVSPTTVQRWYGVDLTHDLVGDGLALRFQSVAPPAAGSVDVYLVE